jgi:Zn-dependent protease
MDRAPEESPPPSFTWHAGPAAPVAPSPELHSPTAPRARRAGGVAGTAAAAAGVAAKYGLVLLKLGKLAPTLLSMLVALFFYAVFFGPAFGIGVVLLILVHELGHVAASLYEGVPMSAPIFLGPFGAMTRVRAPFRSPRQEAVIALGGPLLGTAAALGCYAIGESLQPGYMRFLLISLAYFGCVINLFNLVPMSPLDGGRIASGISIWMNVVGVVIMAAIVLLFGNPFALLILIFGVITTVQRFRAARQGRAPALLAPRARLGVGVVYIAMLLIAAGGMTVTHNAEVSGQYVPGVTQPSGNL